MSKTDELWIKFRDNYTTLIRCWITFRPRHLVVLWCLRVPGRNQLKAFLCVWLSAWLLVHLKLDGKLEIAGNKYLMCSLNEKRMNSSTSNFTHLINGELVVVYLEI